MNTYTPGPWKASCIGYGSNIQPEIAWVGYGSSYPKETHKANALLLAAAPDMLKALHAANCYLASESPSIYDVMTAREFIVNAIYKADPQHDFRYFKNKQSDP